MIMSEWFGSKASAERAAERIQKYGCYATSIKYAMRADGRHDWLLKVFAK